LITVGSFEENHPKMISINEKAPVKCSMTITINASSEIVWHVLTDINNWSTWQTDINRSQLNGEMVQGTTFNWKTGGTKIHSTLQTIEPFKHFGWKGRALGVFAIHTWALTDIDGQTTVLVEESMEGFLAGMFKGSFSERLNKGIRNWLLLLRKECENR